MDHVFQRRDLIAPYKKEQIIGVFCWVAYLFGIPALLTYLLMLGGVDVTTRHGYSVLQIADFVSIFIVIVLFFRNFFWRSLAPLRGQVGRLVSTVAFGFLAYYLLMNLVVYLIYIIGITPENRNNETIETLLTENSIPMFFCTVLLAPVTEECLVRGVVFAPLCRHRPWLAYLVTVPLFAFLHIFSYIGQQSAVLLAISFLQYLPAGFVFGWAYQRTGSIYGPLLLHCAINLIASLAMLA